MENTKFYLNCKRCNHRINSFVEWFQHHQACPSCGSLLVDVVYLQPYENITKLIKNQSGWPQSLWHYFDYLPLINKENIVSAGGEGVQPIDRWEFLEQYAKRKYGRSIKVYAHRNDRNHATGTFKDLAGTVVASVLKESGIKNYVASSTGNIGTAYSRYLAAAEISLSVFIPITSTKAQESEIGMFGQRVYRVQGDYHEAKLMAAKFAKENKFVLTGGNFDPMRIEAKKVMVYEWLRALPEFPTVFMQAISGGSGPIGIEKACRELADTSLKVKLPRFILPQPNRCAPMAEAWDLAKDKKFPQGWEQEYPIYENPQTIIPTLSTGNPNAYPALAPMVKESGGEILSSNEDRAYDVSRLLAYELGVKLGPASSITVVGFFESLWKGFIKDGDVVLLNIGEGVGRAPEFVEKLAYTTQNVNSHEECIFTDRKIFSKHLWNAIETI